MTKQLVVKIIGVHDAYLLDEVKLKKLAKPSGLFYFLTLLLLASRASEDMVCRATSQL
jgi:hypothetical protein